MSKNKFLSSILTVLVITSVFAGGFAGSALAASSGDYDEELTDGGLYWQNQELLFNDGSVSAGDTVTLRQVTDNGNEFVAEFAADSAGDIVINTGNFNAGSFEVTMNGSTLASYEVASQSFSVTTDDSTAYNVEDSDENTAEFTFDSNRAGYTVQVTETTGELSTEELRQLFNGEVSEVSVATVSADPSNPGESATHTVTIDVSNQSTSLNGLAVDYSDSDADMSNVGAEDVSVVGIDRDGDDAGNAVDDSAASDLSSVDTSNNGQTLTFNFGGSYSLSEGDEVVVEFSDAVNPSQESTSNVQVDVNPQSTGDEQTATLFSSDSENVRFDIASNSDTVTANFSDANTGDYEFEFSVVDTDVSDTTTVSVQEAGDSSASFDRNVYTEVTGDTVEMTVSLENTNSAVVTFGGDDANYEHSATISEADDNQVTLLFDTTEAGDGDAESPWSLHEDSDARLTPDSNESTLSSALQAYNYGLTVSVDGFESDLSTVSLEERNTEGVSVHTLPGNTDVSLDTIQSDSTQVDEVAEGDYLIAAVEASGLYAQITNDTTGADLTNGSTFAQDTGIEMSVVDTDAGPNQGEVEYDISSGEVFADEANDTFYLVLDTANLDNEEGDSPTVNFEMTQANAYIEDEDEAEAQSASAEFEFVDRTFDYNNLNDDNVVEVMNSDTATVSGTTTVAPGTEFTVDVRSETGASNPFTFSQTVTVTEDGMVEAEFDLSDYEAGQEFTISVRDIATDRQDAVLLSTGPQDFEVTMTVEDDAGETVPNATVTIDGETYTTDENGQATVTLTENQSYSADVTADGYLTTTQPVSVTEDTELTVTISEEPTEYATTVEVVDENGTAVAGALVAVNGDTYSTDQDGMVTVNLPAGDYQFAATAQDFQESTQTVTVDSESSVSLTLTSVTPSEPADTETATPDNGTEQESPDGNNSDGGDATETSSSGQPGFGAAISIVALAGAALIAYRRD